MIDLTTSDIAPRRGFCAALGEPWRSASRGLHQSLCMRKPRLQMTVQIGREHCKDAIARW